MSIQYPHKTQELCCWIIVDAVNSALFLKKCKLPGKTGRKKLEVFGSAITKINVPFSCPVTNTIMIYSVISLMTIYASTLNK